MIPTKVIAELGERNSLKNRRNEVCKHEEATKALVTFHAAMINVFKAAFCDHTGQRNDVYSNENSCENPIASYVIHHVIVLLVFIKLDFVNDL